MSSNSENAQIASLIRHELENFKNTTLRSMELKFTEALAKINTNTVADEMLYLKEKMRKVMDNQNKLINALLTPKELNGEAENTIKLLEKENATLHTSLKANISSLEGH